MDNFPRRQCLDKMTEAERAIFNASLAVEEIGADPGLTEAVILLEAARNHVADFVDGIAYKDPTEKHPYSEYCHCVPCLEQKIVYLHKSRTEIIADNIVKGDEIAALRERLEECRHELCGMSNVFFNLKQGATMREGEAERYQHGCERVAAKALDALRA